MLLVLAMARQSVWESAVQSVAHSVMPLAAETENWKGRALDCEWVAASAVKSDGS